MLAACLLIAADAPLNTGPLFLHNQSITENSAIRYSLIANHNPNPNPNPMPLTPYAVPYVIPYATPYAMETTAT